MCVFIENLFSLCHYKFYRYPSNFWHLFIHISKGLPVKTGNYPLVLSALIVLLFPFDDYFIITVLYNLTLVSVKINSNVLILTSVTIFAVLLVCFFWFRIMCLFPSTQKSYIQPLKPVSILQIVRCQFFHQHCNILINKMYFTFFKRSKFVYVFLVCFLMVPSTLCCSKFYLLFLRFYLFVFKEGKGGRKREKETSICSCLSCTPLLGTWPTTQACALD